MEMESPRLSVVIPCLNAEEFLGVQLSALLAQGSPVPWEILVCDNGSTDRTVEIAYNWSPWLPIRVVDASATPGAGPARNVGVEHAQGEWIGFCDADDMVGDGWTAALCAALAEHTFVAGRIDNERLNPPHIRRSRASDQVDGPQTSPTTGLPHAAAANLGIHRSTFLSVGGFDPAVKHLEDTDLCWRVQLAGDPLVFVPELLVHMRLRGSWRAMYRQGHDYGAAQALLERRYPRAEQHDETGALTRIARGAARLSRHYLSSRSLGAQIWQIGWHMGHRAC